MQKVDYADPEYKKINPLGMVPALDIGGSRAMTQANAILQYIADSHPAAKLGAAGASGVPGGSLMLIPMACSLLGIDGQTSARLSPSVCLSASSRTAPKPRSTPPRT